MAVRQSLAGLAAAATLGGVGCTSDSGGSSPPPPAAASACSSIVSLIGYAEELLLPAGQEDDQVFDSAVRGRIAEVVGTVEQEAAALPESLRDLAADLAAAARTAVPARTAHEVQVAALREFRRLSTEVTASCESLTETN